MGGPFTSGGTPADWLNRGREDRRKNEFDVAQICPNGHVITASAGSSPEFKKAHCPECGDATLMACPKCQTPIQGRYLGGLGLDYKRPSCCYNCGQAFPWTERKQQAAIDLFIDEVQDEEQRKQFKESVEQIAKDTPQAQVASNRIVKLLAKFPGYAGKAIRDILVEVAAEATKRNFLPPGGA